MNLKRSKLSLLITSILLGATIQAAEAEDAVENEGQLSKIEKRQKVAEDITITVVGTRGAIQRASELKRTADSLIEVITMEDIGQLPDSDVATVLERMGNVTSSTWKGEGFHTLIRGLSPDMTAVTYNGRELAGAQEGRDLATSKLPSGILHRVSVLKSTTANVIEGGMAGTVQLESIKPLSMDKREIHVKAKIIEDNMVKNSYVDDRGHELGISYFDQFNDNTLGVALTVGTSSRPKLAYQSRFQMSQKDQLVSRENRNADGVKTDGFGDLNGDGNLDFLAVRNMPEIATDHKEQTSAGFAVQWRPDDSPWEINFDSMYAQESYDDYIIRDNMRFRNGATFSNLVTDDSLIGTAMANDGTEYNGALVTSYDIEGGEYVKHSINKDKESKTTAVGLNIARTFGDDWLVSLDIASSHAEAYADSAELQARHRQLGWSIDTLADHPAATNVHSSLTGLPVDLTNPVWSSNHNNGVTPFIYKTGFDGKEDDLDSVRLDFDKLVDWGTVSQLSFGVRAVEREKRAWKHQGQDTNNPFCGPDAAVDCDTLEIAAGLASTGTNSPHYELLNDVGANQVFDLNVQDVFLQRGILSQEEYSSRDQAKNALNGYRIEEDYLAAFVRLDFDHQIGDTYIWGNLGLRYVDTTSVSTNLTSTFTVTANDDGDFTRVDSDFDPENPNFVANVSEYSELLPSVNLVIEPRDDFQIRLAFGKSMSRPKFSNMGKALKIDSINIAEGEDPVTQLTGESGNPFLDAFTATNFDASFEWYANEDTSLTLAYFHKDVSGHIRNDQYLLNLTDQNGLEVPVLIDGVVNADEEETFSGWELGFQQAFTFLPGFLQHTGISMNYSILNSDVESNLTYAYMDNANSTPGNAGSCAAPGNTDAGVICTYAVTGPDNFADYTANATLYYNDKDLNVRVSFRKKADQVRTNRGGYGYENGYNIVDLSASYNFIKNLRVTFAVNNLTNQSSRRYWQDAWGSASESNLQHNIEYGRRYNLGVTYKFK